MRFNETLVVAMLGVCTPWTWQALGANPEESLPAVQQPDLEREMLERLDAPLLFVKRHSYTGIHIYDTYYKWPPGGGGIYVLENPARPARQWKIRPVIDPEHAGNARRGRLQRSRTLLGRHGSCCSASRASRTAARASTRSASTARGCGG